MRRRSRRGELREVEPPFARFLLQGAGLSLLQFLHEARNFRGPTSVIIFAFVDAYILHQIFIYGLVSEISDLFRNERSVFEPRI